MQSSAWTALLMRFIYILLKRNYILSLSEYEKLQVSLLLIDTVNLNLTFKIITKEKNFV